MEKKMRQDAETIIRSAIHSCLPDEAVKRALAGRSFPGKVILVAIGKAAWRMAAARLGYFGRKRN